MSSRVDSGSQPEPRADPEERAGGSVGRWTSGTGRCDLTLCYGAAPGVRLRRSGNWNASCILRLRKRPPFPRTAMNAPRRRAQPLVSARPGSVSFRSGPQLLWTSGLLLATCLLVARPAGAQSFGLGFSAVSANPVSGWSIWTDVNVGLRSHPSYRWGANWGCPGYRFRGGIPLPGLGLAGPGLSGTAPGLPILPAGARTAASSPGRTVSAGPVRPSPGPSTPFPSPTAAIPASVTGRGAARGHSICTSRSAWARATGGTGLPGLRQPVARRARVRRQALRQPVVRSAIRWRLRTLRHPWVRIPAKPC